MKKLISLGASLSVAGISLLGVTSSANAAIFSVGDSVSGSSGATGLFGIGVDLADPLQPARNFFGTTITPPGAALPISGTGFTTFTYAPISDPTADPTATAATSIGLSATGGFAPLAVSTGQFRSFQSAVNPDLSAGFTSVLNFLTANAGGLDLAVSLNGVIISSTGAGNAITFEVPVIVTGTTLAETETVNGVFRFSTQNIFAANPVSSGDGLIDVFTGGQTYSWQLDVVSTAVPEPSSVVSVLALGVLGGGLALKRKALK